MTSRITSKNKGAKAVSTIKKSSSRRSSISNREENGSVIEEKLDKKLKNPIENPNVKTRKNVTKCDLKSRSKAPTTPTSSRVTKSQYFPSKSIYSDALKSLEKDELLEKKKKDVKSSSKDSKLLKSSSKDVKPSKNTVKDSKTTQGNLKASKSLSKTVLTPKNSSMVASKSKELQNKQKIASKSIVDIRKAKTVPIKDIPIEIYSKSPDSSSVSVLSDRPRTATLRKGSIVNANIVGPDVPKRQSKSKSKDDLKPENDYEDDFESYESDFEVYSSSTKSSVSQNSSCSSSSCSSPEEDIEEPLLAKEQPLQQQQQRVSSASTDDERKMDSGNFDLPDYKHKQILDNIKESLERENSQSGFIDGSTVVEKSPNPASLSDEGFEEAKSLQYINFLDAKRKTERKKSIEIRKKRGEEILSMIRLDAFSFTIFDSPAISYEEFIQIYGKTNCVQTGAQTGEDDLDEEVQTESVLMLSKWTQCPQVFSNFTGIEDERFWIKYKEEFLGVGADEDDLKIQFMDRKNQFNENGLRKYMSLAGKLILNLLEESSLEINDLNKTQLPFSDGYFKINTETDLFSNSSLTGVSFHEEKNHFITAHQENIEKYSFISLWEIHNLDKPKKTFLCHGLITSLYFGSNLILAGLENGTISLWSLDNEKSDLIPASFTSKISSGHLSKIIGIAMLQDNENKILNYKSLAQTKEIVTLDMDGVLITWIIHLKSIQTKILQNIKTDLKEVYKTLNNLECTDFILDNSQPNMNYLYIATNYGFIVHHLINNASRNELKSFKNNSLDTLSANCLEKCPFSTKYFLCGYSDGKMNLFSRSNEKPLMGLHNYQEQSNSGLKLIQWSRNCPFIFYSLDNANNIHIWDLNESDIFPIYSVPFQERVISFKISPMQLEYDNKSSYMVIGTESGLYLHLLNKQHGKQSKEVYLEQKNTFFNYVNRL